MIVGYTTTYAISVLSPLPLWDRILLRWSVLNTTLCDKVCQWLAAGQWFSPGSLVSSISKTNCHDITEILLKVALSTITLTLKLSSDFLLGSNIYKIVLYFYLKFFLLSIALCRTVLYFYLKFFLLSIALCRTGTIFPVVSEIKFLKNIILESNQECTKGLLNQLIKMLTLKCVHLCFISGEFLQLVLVY
jgi:hypothetical protein